MRNKKLPYCFEDSRTTFCVPAFDPAPELLAGVVDSIVVFLIVDWPRQAIAKHAFRERWEGVVRVLLEEFCRGGRVAFFWVYRFVDRRSKLEELVFSCSTGRSAESGNNNSGIIHMGICRGSTSLTSCHCP